MFQVASPTLAPKSQHDARRISGEVESADTISHGRPGIPQKFLSGGRFDGVTWAINNRRMMAPAAFWVESAFGLISHQYVIY